MKRFLLLMLMVLSSIGVYSQEAATVVVALKSGTTITGHVKQFDPTTKIVLSIGGIDTTINMSDVASVTPASNVATTASTDASMGDVIAPALGLPEDTVINICGVDVKFILMRGGKFKYGFDGRGSMSMDSEPVHDVELTPFYVSEEFVSRDLYRGVTKTEFPADFVINYTDIRWGDESLDKCAFFMSKELGGKKDLPSVESFLTSLQTSYGSKFDLPTEVQWFYFESNEGRNLSLLKSPNWVICQFAWKVSMLETYNPAKLSLVVKGITTHGKTEDFDVYRLHDRSTYRNTNISSRTFVGGKVYKLHYKISASNEAVCPIRLVMQAKQ